MPFQRELVSAMGIDLETVVDSSRVLHVQADQLVVPSHPDPYLDAPQWTISHLRDRLLPAGVARVPGRRLYIPRAGKRNNRIVRNEGEVRHHLERRGFCTVDPGAMSVADQVTMFAEADIVVAPHGAALANLAFASPGCLAVEIFAPDGVATFFWGLAERVPGLEYRYLVGGGTRSAARRRAQKGATSDMTVDVGLLDLLLDQGRCHGSPPRSPSRGGTRC